VTPERTAADPIRCIDTLQYGIPRRGAAYLLVGERSALVEAGTPRSAAALLDRLAGTDLAHVFVTHVHLDHAGAAGALAAAHPEAVVVAHPRAVRHLADPSRLVEGVRQASPDLFPLYGQPTPVPAAQLRAAEDGERFELGGGLEVEVLYTPGHAPHHACFFERATRTLFTGDAVGNHGIPIDVPLTVPPGFDRLANRETLRRLRASRPGRLAVTHFGFVEESPIEHIDRYERDLSAWFARIEELSRTKDPGDIVREIVDAAPYLDLDPTDRFSVEMCVRGAVLTLASSAEG